MAKKKQSKARKFGRAVLKTLLIIVLVLLIAVGALLGWLSYTEYKPADVEPILTADSLTVAGAAAKLPLHDSINV